MVKWVQYGNIEEVVVDGYIQGVDVDGKMTFFRFDLRR